MKVLLVLASLLSLTGNPYQWKFLGETQSLFAYIDTANLKKYRDKQWLSIVEVRYKREQAFDDGERYDAIRSLTLNDCGKPRFKILTLAAIYNGKVVEEIVNKNVEWLPIVEGAPSASAWHVVCGTQT